MLKIVGNIQLRGFLTLGRVVSTSFSIFLVTSLWLSGLIQSTVDKSIRPLEFKLRDKLGYSPDLSPAIKVFSFDDSTLRSIQDNDLEFSKWVDIFDVLDNSNPKLIMVDKTFAIAKGKFNSTKLSTKVLSFDAPIAAGLYLSGKKLHSQDPLDIYKQSADINEGVESLPLKEAFVNGPDSRIVKVFKKLGHIMYEGDGMVDLFWRYSKQSAIPHWSLMSSNSYSIDGESVVINGQRISTDSGRIFVNFIDPKILKNKIYSLQTLANLAESKSTKPLFGPEKYIVILPAMFTGNSDMVSTPYGTIPGGYVMVSMVNSILSNLWIRTIPTNVLFIIVPAILGLFIAAKFRFSPSAFIMIGSSIAIVVAGFLIFAVYSIQTPWFITANSFFLSCLFNMIWITHERDRETRRLHQAISGLLPKYQIDELLRRSAPLNLTPAGQVLSIMFIDIVNFTETSSRLSPKVAFSQLKNLLGDITEIVHMHNGTIDKTLGDGLLCFFGYSILGESVPNHADLALKCAIEIQKYSVRKTLQSHEEHQAIYPFRIGINTASVYIGDIGNDKRFDFTLVGDGVNFASRLEASCAPYKIMIGPSTKAHLMEFSSNDPRIHRRFIMPKHSSEIKESWQVDPFYHHNEDFIKAESLFLKSIVKDVDRERLNVPENISIALTSNLGHFNLIDFSLTGLRISGNIFLARGVIFHVTIDSEDGEINRMLRKSDLGSITVEVFWGKVDGKEYHHGVKFIGLNREQKQRIFSILHRYSGLTKSA